MLYNFLLYILGEEMKIYHNKYFFGILLALLIQNLFYLSTDQISKYNKVISKI
jgi:hypothetical protein